MAVLVMLIWANCPTQQATNQEPGVLDMVGQVIYSPQLYGHGRFQLFELGKLKDFSIKLKICIFS